MLEAAQLIRKGQVYQLGSVYEEDMPLASHRHFSVLMPVPNPPQGENKLVGMEELLIAEIGQVGTQLDGLGHVGIGNIFYNGNDRRDFQTAKGLTRLGIENVGVFLTRGLLLDVAALKGVQRLKDNYEITPEDLKTTLYKEKLTINPGDVVLIHTGWGGLWKVDNEAYSRSEPGIGVSAAQFLVDQQISLVGSDNWGIEVIPGPDPEVFGLVHQILLTLNGIYHLECIDTSELARDQVYEFAFFFAPLRLKGFTGSPGNPVAIR